MNVIVYERCQQVVSRCDCVEVAREMQIDVLHRNYLSVSAAAGSALDAEHGAEGGLAERQRNLSSGTVQPVGKAYAYRRFAFSERSGIHCRNKYEFAAFALGAGGHLGLVFSVTFGFVGGVAEFCRDFGYGTRGNTSCDFGVGEHLFSPWISVAYTSRKAVATVCVFFTIIHPTVFFHHLGRRRQKNIARAGVIIYNNAVNGHICKGDIL